LPKHTPLKVGSDTLRGPSRNARKYNKVATLNQKSNVYFYSRGPPICSAIVQKSFILLDLGSVKIFSDDLLKLEDYEISVRPHVKFPKIMTIVHAKIVLKTSYKYVLLVPV
jgi:hypothetical protein